MVHQAALHGAGKGFLPDKGIALAVEVHSAHAVLGGVRRTQQGGTLGHNLSKARGPVAQTGR
jgi:hypothetical protein